MTIWVCAASHDVSSRDVRIVCPRLNVISRGNTPLTFLLSPTFRETWRRDLRVECSSDLISQFCLQKNILFMSAATLKPVRLECYLPWLPGAKSSREITWHDDMGVCRLIWRELTWREDSVSPVLAVCTVASNLCLRNFVC